MKVNYEKLNRTHWFEDAEGNEVDKDNPKAEFYHHCFPCELNHNVDSYRYRPKNPVVKLLCKNDRFYNYMAKKYGKTFKPCFTMTTTFGATWSQECIVAMVNSGDFTLEQAIYVFANSCERCMNVLLYKYLDGKEGYEEYSEEWKKCGTVCDFCKEDKAGDQSD